ncbi:hypothetical protein CYMTET_52880 [Cymbomonas tetramitiformis]|uniref:Uncharacterized protein n=1 Tax=Cymbomonas tetramitiformis TaxID=36881 RepID=A0AAE0ER64_9CHLO|nr:hypothetical protein CYMTET_52880 [Cymbomonas tetramitiformis]|eukprot:gene2821-3617_t
MALSAIAQLAFDDVQSDFRLYQDTGFLNFGFPLQAADMEQLLGALQCEKDAIVVPESIHMDFLANRTAVDDLATMVNAGNQFRVFTIDPRTPVSMLQGLIDYALPGLQSRGGRDGSPADMVDAFCELQKLWRVPCEPIHGNAIIEMYGLKGRNKWVSLLNAALSLPVLWALAYAGFRLVDQI